MQILGNKKYLSVGIILGVVATILLIYTTPLRYTDLVEPQINDIDAKAFYDNYSKNPDHYIFLDVRSEDAYKNLHAKGSTSRPLFNMYDDRHVLPKTSKEIVLICSGGRASGVAYSYLEHYGFTNIARIGGGIEKWVEYGLPTESSIWDKNVV